MKETRYTKILRSYTKEGTGNIYARQVNLFFKEVYDTEEPPIELLRELTVGQVNAWLLKKQDEGLSHETISLKRKALNKLFSILMRRQYRLVDFNPFDTQEGALQFDTPNYSLTTPLTDEELQKLSQYFSKDTTLKGHRNYLIFLLLATTGMRVREVLSIRLENFARWQDQGAIHIYGKGGIPRLVVVPYSVKMEIDHYISRQCLSYEEHKDLYLFESNICPDEPIEPSSVYRFLQQAKEACGIEKPLTAHVFRHTYITKSLAIGCDIVNVSKRVGHQSLATTLRYDHTNRIFDNNPNEEFANIIQF